MSIEESVAAALQARLAADPAIALVVNGIYLERTVRATPPWIEVLMPVSADWSVKGARGRELRLAVIVRDAGEAPTRLLDLLDAAGAAIEALPRALGGWQLGAAVFLRSRTAREANGQWIGSCDYRLRAIEI